MNLNELVFAIVDGKEVNWDEVKVEPHEEHLLPQLKIIYLIVLFRPK